MSRPLTEAQKRYLRQAMLDGGELIVGGSDQSEIGPQKQTPRQDVINRLWQLGYLRFPVGLTSSVYKVTEMAEAWWEVTK